MKESRIFARDKTLSNFNSYTFGFGLSAGIAKGGWRFVGRGSLSPSYDYLRFQYDDFRDLTSSAPVGEEPLYRFSANIWMV